mgnify:CR=1 FL=1
MANHDNTKLSITNLRPRKLLLAGMPFFVAGALVATGFHGTRTLSAGDTVAAEQNQVIESPSMPTSFAELADKLSPSVVNVKVTKVTQAAFPGPEMHGNPFGDKFGDFFGLQIRDDGTHLANLRMLVGVFGKQQVDLGIERLDACLKRGIGSRQAAGQENRIFPVHLPLKFVAAVFHFPQLQLG